MDEFCLILLCMFLDSCKKINIYKWAEKMYYYTYHHSVALYRFGSYFEEWLWFIFPTRWTILAQNNCAQLWNKTHVISIKIVWHLLCLLKNLIENFSKYKGWCYLYLESCFNLSRLTHIKLEHCATTYVEFLDVSIFHEWY